MPTESVSYRLRTRDLTYVALCAVLILPLIHICFQSVELREPGRQRLLEIVERVARVRYPQTDITKEAISETTRLAALCAPERSEPARSLELLHYTVSAAQINLPPGEYAKEITADDARGAAALKMDRYLEKDGQPC